MKTVDFLGVTYQVGDWITDGTPPPEPGVYNVSCRKKRQSGDFFAHWDGYAWSTARDRQCIFPHEDWAARVRIGSGRPWDVSRDHWHSNGSYRGLLKPYKEQHETV